MACIRKREVILALITPQVLCLHYEKDRGAAGSPEKRLELVKGLGQKVI